uniref:Reverse transcriptase domain-containing protein n=1 Tax=Angiostrongylus cantonensis TaxID=6313 RepID=A0A0K0CX44_ANGCA
MSRLILFKTHELKSADDLASTDPSTLKARPITCCVDGPANRIAWFINLILNQLLKHIAAHLTNTQMFLDRLRNGRLKIAYVMETIDVTALYTNVPNDYAIQAIRELLEQYERAINMYGFSILRGLAIGQRLAPTLAVACMSKLEAPVIDLRPLLYCRKEARPTGGGRIEMNGDVSVLARVD